MTAVLRSRLMKPGDAQLCARWLISGLSVSQALAAGLVAQITQLLDREQIKALAIEELSSTGQWTSRGVGVSGFITPALIDAQLADPKPFFLVELLRHAAAGTEVFLTPAQIGRASADAGLDLVVEYMQEGWDFTDPLWRSVAMIAHETYVKHHRGYRLRRVLSEFWTAHSDTYLTAGYRVLHTFELGAEQIKGIATAFGGQRALCYADGTGPPGLTVVNAFQFAEPRCRFTLAEQRVLLSGADGLSDAEIASEQGWSANAVKLAWRAIYKRVQSHAPFVLAEDGAREKDGRRGPEKRRRVLAFVERHPEELRPFYNARKIAGR